MSLKACSMPATLLLRLPGKITELHRSIKVIFPLSDQLHASQWATREVGSWRLSKQEPRGLEGNLLPRPLCAKGGQGWHRPHPGLAKGHLDRVWGTAGRSSSAELAGQNVGLTTWETLRTYQAEPGRGPSLGIWSGGRNGANSGCERSLWD